MPFYENDCGLRHTTSFLLRRASAPHDPPDHPNALGGSRLSCSSWAGTGLLPWPGGHLAAAQVQLGRGHPPRRERGWTPEQAVALLEQGYPAERVADRTGYDLRWVTAQQRRLTRA